MNTTNSRSLHRVLTLASMLLVLTTGSPEAKADGTLPPGGTWENTTDLLWAQGPRFYDRSARQFYTENLIINASSEPVTGPVRLLVTTSSHPVVNADGEEDGQAYFTVLDTGETLAPNAEVTVTVRFQPQRARFGYDMVVQQYVVTDSDDDGIPDTEDLCPTDPQNRCFTINGEVYGGGAALAGTDVVIGNGAGATTVVTNGTGRFSATGIGIDALASDNLNRFFPVKAQASNYADAYAKVVLVPGTTTYEVVLHLDVISDRITDQDDLAQGVPIEEGGQTVGSIQIPPSAFPSGVTQITGEVTYLDPATELHLAPGGDLLALPAGADPNDPPTPLESYGMMKFDLVDQNGAPIHQLAGDAEVCMRAPAGLAEGDSLPLWYYDETRGLWIEEGQGTVVDRNGRLMICGMVSHFTWWNYDRPITSHACFKYRFVDELTGAPLDDIMTWYAQGVTYGGTSPESICRRDSDDPVTGSNGIEGLTVKRSTPTTTERIRVYTLIYGAPYYLVRDGDGTYSLTPYAGLATVFDNPMAQGSCLYSRQVENCRFLDYLDTDPDGILPLGGIDDFPPMITDFTIGNDELMEWSTTWVRATVTDPEDAGPVTLNWTLQCWNGADGAITPTSQSGPSGSYSATFTAPSNVPGYYDSCRIELTATDATGNSTTAVRRVEIYKAEGIPLYLWGRLIGTDGTPLSGHRMDITVAARCNGETFSVTTNPDGYYGILAILPYECPGWPSLSVTKPTTSVTRDIVYEISYDYGGLDWTHTETFWVTPHAEFPVCDFEQQGVFCFNDVFLPTVWAPLSGDLVFSGGNPDNLLITRNDDKGHATYPLAPGQTSYGPVLVPIGEVTVGAETIPGQPIAATVYVNEITGTSLDLGDLASGTVHVKAFDTNGGPGANLDITLYAEDGTTRSATTDANGEATFTGVPTGAVTLTAGDASAQGYLTRNGGQLLLEIGARNACTLMGRVYEPDGTPIANTSFAVYGNRWDEDNLFTDANGYYTLSGVRAGRLFLQNWTYISSSSIAIPNCEPDSDGNPPIVNWDVLLEEYDWVFIDWLL